MLVNECDGLSNLSIDQKVFYNCFFFFLNCVYIWTWRKNDLDSIVAKTLLIRSFSFLRNSNSYPNCTYIFQGMCLWVKTEQQSILSSPVCHSPSPGHLLLFSLYFLHNQSPPISVQMSSTAGESSSSSKMPENAHPTTTTEKGSEYLEQLANEAEELRKKLDQERQKLNDIPSESKPRWSSRNVIFFQSNKQPNDSS